MLYLGKVFKLPAKLHMKINTKYCLVADTQKQQAAEECFSILVCLKNFIKVSEAQ